jgi:predicted aldo/keto reductase-like oxidoreductase
VTHGFAATLTEAATRFALSHPAMGTILVGMATPQQFEDAPRPAVSAAAGLHRRTTLMTEVC